MFCEKDALHISDGESNFFSSSFLDPASYLSLCNAQCCRQLCPFRQRQVLRPLEPPLQLLDLEGGVDGPGLPDLLPLSVDPGDDLAVLDVRGSQRRALTWGCVDDRTSHHDVRDSFQQQQRQRDRHTAARRNPLRTAR